MPTMNRCSQRYISISIVGDSENVVSVLSETALLSISGDNADANETALETALMQTRQRRVKPLNLKASCNP
jgi:hypothetical protein